MRFAWLLLFGLLAPLRAEPDPAALERELIGRAATNLAVRQSDKPDAPVTALYGDLFDAQGGPEATAKAFLARYGAVLGVPAELPADVAVSTASPDDRGTIATLVPMRAQLAYHSGAVKVHLAASGKVVAAVGRYRALKNVQPGSMNANGAVKRALSELARKFPGTWLSSDGIISEYLQDGPGGAVRHVYDVNLTIGARREARRVLLGPGGEVLSEGPGSNGVDGMGTVYVGYPNLVSAPMPIVDLVDQKSPPGMSLTSAHFEPTGEGSDRARSRNGYFFFQPELEQTYADTEKRMPDPLFLETSTYYHLTVARQHAIRWGAKEVDKKKLKYDVWALPRFEDNAEFRPSDNTLRFSAKNTHRGNRHPAIDYSILYHEYAHYLRHMVNPKIKEGGSDWAFYNCEAVNEGFADFFSSKITGQPHHAIVWNPDRHRRIDSPLKYCDVSPASPIDHWEDRTPVLRHGGKTELHEAGKCFSGLCSDLERVVGADIMPMLVTATRITRNPGTFQNMCYALLAVELVHYSGTRYAAMFEAMRKRGIFDSSCPEPEE